MKEKYFINARIIDPSQNLDEVGGVIVDQNGKIKAVGKILKRKYPSQSKKNRFKGKNSNTRNSRYESVYWRTWF